MLIDDLDRIARGYLESILKHIEGVDMPFDQKTSLHNDLSVLKDVLGTLDVQGLRHVNEVLQSIMGMLQQPGLMMFEPISGLLLSLMKLLGSGGSEHEEEREGSRQPSPGIDR